MESKIREVAGEMDSTSMIGILGRYPGELNFDQARLELQVSLDLEYEEAQALLKNKGNIMHTYEALKESN